jgi:hypothetical protein
MVQGPRLHYSSNQSAKPNQTMVRKGKSPAKLWEPKTNANGEIMNWDSSWSDAAYLQMLVETGKVDGLTASQVQKHFPQFQKYANKTLTDGLKTARDSFAKEEEVVHGPGSSGRHGANVQNP